jgi:hypothetical protein
VTQTPLALEALPSVRASSTVVAAPGIGDGYWAGGPSAIYTDGAFFLAYRLRRPVGEGRGYANIVATSTDGVQFAPLVTLASEDYGCDSLERPALVRRPDGGWRIYLSLATRGTKHWSVVALDADEVTDLGSATPHSVWPGDPRTVAVKDPVVRYADGAWQAWVCCHPLTEAGEEDRMTTRYATSADGLDWTWQEDALVPTAGSSWDRRGARLTSVVAGSGGSADLAFYDGRSSAAQNWYERTGLARAQSSGGFVPIGSSPLAESPYGERTLRYVSTVALPDGGLRAYFEAAAEAGGNDLRTQLLDPEGLRALAAAGAAGAR